MSDLKIEDMPLGGIRETDILFRETNDGTCSRCRERFGTDEVPLLLWPERAKGEDLYQYCQRCAWDPESDRCKLCGCTHLYPCEMPCGWAEPGLCTNCAPMIRPTLAHLNTESDRAEDWKAVFGGLDVPLLSPLPILASGPEGVEPFYQVDVAKLTPEQIDRAVTHISERFSVPADEVREGVLHGEGIPIRVNDVVVSFDARLV